MRPAPITETSQLLVGIFWLLLLILGCISGWLIASIKKAFEERKKKNEG